MPKRSAIEASDETTPKRTKRAGGGDKTEHQSQTGGIDVLITSSKACQAFTKHHDLLRRLIGEKNPKLRVEIVVEKKLSSKPDRGNFIVVAKGKPIVELKAIPRPFTAMKSLDMDDVASRVVSEFA